MATYTPFLFGAPRLERDGALVKIPRRRALALLAYLAAMGQPHALDTLATLFRSDHSQREARLALSRHLSFSHVLIQRYLYEQPDNEVQRDLFVHLPQLQHFRCKAFPEKYHSQFRLEKRSRSSLIAHRERDIYFAGTA